MSLDKQARWQKVIEAKARGNFLGSVEIFCALDVVWRLFAAPSPVGSRKLWPESGGVWRRPKKFEFQDRSPVRKFYKHWIAIFSALVKFSHLYFLSNYRSCLTDLHHEWQYLDRVASLSKYSLYWSKTLCRVTIVRRGTGKMYWLHKRDY